MPNPLTPEAVSEHNRLYRSAVELIRGEAFLGKGVKRARPTLFSRWRLRRGIGLLKKAIRINPSWQNHFWIGKALQSLDDWVGAVSHFTAAAGIAPSEASIAQELAISQMELGNVDSSIAALQSVATAEADYHVFHNLGIAYLLRGRIEDSIIALRRATETAGAQAASDSHALLEFAYAAKAGARRLPTTLKQLEYELQQSQ